MKYLVLLCACTLSVFGCGEEEAPSTNDMVNMMTGGTMSMPPLGGAMMTPATGGTMMMMPQDQNGGPSPGGEDMPQGGNTPQGGNNMMPQGGNNMTPPPTPAQNCGELLSCLTTCAQTDMACQQNCFDAATPNALSEYSAFEMCAQGSGCAPDDTNCIQMNCGPQLDACRPQGSQYQNCGELVSCLRLCPPNNMGCQQGCFGSATRNAQDSYSALSTCAQGAGCAGDDLMCVETNCGNELDVCTPQGTGTCAQILQCLQTCTNPNDQSCGLSCIESGSLDAQDRFIDIEECLVDNCMPSDQACIQMAVGPGGACGQFLSACQSN